MLIQVRTGSIKIVPEGKKPNIVFSVSDRGGLDGSPPYSVEVEMTGEEARHVASALLQAEKEISDCNSKMESAGA